MGNSTVSIIITVVVAHFLALLSPGPDFILVVKSGISNRKRSAIGIAFGIASANALYITFCIVGLGEILMRSYILIRIMKICGAIFLLYISIKALTSKKSDYENLAFDDHRRDLKKTSFFTEYCDGFISGITNPKNLIFYLSLFSLILTRESELLIKVSLGVWMSGLVLVWDSLIIFVLSRNRIRTVFSGVVYYIDKIAGIILGTLGFKLLQSSVTEGVITVTEGLS